MTMEVTETLTDGLKRELKVVLPATELSERCDRRIDEMKGRVQLKGFRKGKVPPAHLRKVFGRSIMVEIMQEAVEETSRKALTDRDERPAMQPQIDFSEDEAEIEAVISGKADLAFSMAYEVLPSLEIVDLSTISLEKLVAEVGSDKVDEALAGIAAQNKTYTAVEDRAAETGDRLTIDFVGTIDGEAFEGGTAQDVTIVLGDGNFIAGFEDGLAAAKPGDQRDVTATFPDTYPVDDLKDKTANFAVTVKEVAQPEDVELNDEFAQTLGAESLEALRGALEQRIGAEYEQVSRAKLKRALLDELDSRHPFELPPSLVDNEFEGIWKQMQAQLTQSGKTLENEGKTEEQAREEYRKLAERRVRLGLVLGEIGERAEIKVGQEELRRAIVEQARQYPGQEKAVYEYFEKTPGAVAELRAPIFEEKVVDYIVELAKPTEKTVSVEELTAPLPDDDVIAGDETA
ncbi:MAG: trigger factor [Pseudomonadota bacterium]